MSGLRCPFVRLPGHDRVGAVACGDRRTLVGAATGRQYGRDLGEVPIEAAGQDEGQVPPGAGRREAVGGAGGNDDE